MQNQKNSAGSIALPMVSVKRKFYTMASTDGNDAEITMYGDIVESQPKDPFTGEPSDGQYIIADDFLTDLKQVENCKSIAIRMHSCGGDASVSILIHNRLRELAAKGTALSCTVDGVAMSGGSLIMCACDNVKVNGSSLVMIHKCWSFMFGCYNADDLRSEASTNDAYDKAQVSIYNRKTGLSDTVLLHMMSNTTYMTGKEAVEKGFADELLDNEEAVDIYASADKRTLFVHGRAIRLASGKCPDFIPISAHAGTATPAAAYKNQQTISAKEEHNMAKTVEELIRENPELTKQMLEDARTEAAQDERDRLRGIDEVSALFDSALVADAKYGANACDAKEMTYRAAQAAAQQGRNFLSALSDDAKASKAEEVQASPVESDGEKRVSEKDMTPEQRMARARSIVAETMKKEDK